MMPTVWAEDSAPETDTSLMDRQYKQPELPQIEGLVISPDDPLQKLTAKSAVVMDAATGTILYDRNMNDRHFPASTTKMMTLIIALENGNLDDIVTVGSDAEGTDGSTLWLKAGDKIPLGELLTGMMMHSGNDATIAVADHIAGSVPEFVKMMNDKAEVIGAKDTHFVNPNGLPDDNHYTTAHDLALIAAYGYGIPGFADIVGRQEASYDWVQDPDKKLRNENQMLWLYRGANGVKTGYTEKAGRCLVSGAKRDGVQLVAVVLDSYYMWNDSIALLDYGFSQIEPQPLVKKGDTVKNVSVSGAVESEIPVIAAEDLTAAIKKGDDAKIETKVELPSSLEAPIQKGDVVGKVTCYYNGQPGGSVDLLAGQDVERNTLFMRIKAWFYHLLGWGE